MELKIDKKSLEIDFYEHFKNYYDRRGVAIVTDKQYVLYTQIDKKDNFTHNTALKALDILIYPKKDYLGHYVTDVDIAMHSSYNDLYFYFPHDGLISKNQYDMMKHILEQIRPLNNELPTSMQYIIYFHGRLPELIKHSRNIDEMLEVLDRFHIREYENNPDEIILGTTIESIKRSDDSNRGR